MTNLTTKTITIEEQLLEMGFHVWEKYGHKRIYINLDELHKVIDIEITFYKTGNFSEVILGGEIISNNKARKMLSDKVYFDCVTQKWSARDELLETIKIKEIIKEVQTAIT